MSVLHYNRGSWEPTVFNSLTPDFCTAMFDPNQFWFKYWFKNFANREEMKEKCFSTAGVSIIMSETFKIFSKRIIFSDCVSV